MKTRSQDSKNDSRSELVSNAEVAVDESFVGSRLILEQLVDELIKSNPDQVLVRSQMQAAGLKYSNDAVLSMSLVLQALENGRTLSADKINKRNSNAPKRRERDNVQDL